MNPRLIRMRDAPAYLGMDKSVFNKEVRPGLVEIKIGEQGVAFDRLDLDEWVDLTKSMCVSGATGSWADKNSPAYNSERVRGISTNASKGTAGFAKALAAATRQKRKPS